MVKATKNVQLITETLPNIDICAFYLLKDSLKRTMQIPQVSGVLSSW